MISGGNISFEYLWYLFNVNEKYYFYDATSGYKIESSVVSSKYKKDIVGEYFEIIGNSIVSDEKKFKTYFHTHIIQKFDGLVKITSLRVRLMDEITYFELTERGKNIEN